MIAGKRLVSAVAASALMMAAICSPALARGWSGDGGGERSMLLLARAAGLSRDQIVSAFKNDTNLKTDRSNLKSAKEAVTTCLVSGASCTTQIAAYTSALQTLAQERMNVWQGLFKGAPNPKQASNVLTELQQLQAQRQQIVQQVFGSSSTGSSSSQSQSEEQ